MSVIFNIFIFQKETKCR